MKHASYDMQKTLFEAAFEILQLEPWTFMEEDENFAVTTGAETFYASVIGAC